MYSQPDRWGADSLLQNVIRVNAFHTKKELVHKATRLSLFNFCLPWLCNFVYLLVDFLWGDSSFFFFKLICKKLNNLISFNTHLICFLSFGYIHISWSLMIMLNWKYPSSGYLISSLFLFFFSLSIVDFSVFLSCKDLILFVVCMWPFYMVCKRPIITDLWFLEVLLKFRWHLF